MQHLSTITFLVNLTPPRIRADKHRRKLYLFSTPDVHINNESTVMWGELHTQFTLNTRRIY